MAGASVDLAHVNTASFQAVLDLDAFADLYPLADGVLRMQMRRAAADALVLYEWSTEEDAAFGTLSVVDAPAIGTVAFAEQPTVGSTLTLGGVDLTFVEGGPTANQVPIGVSLEATVANLLARLRAATHPALLACTYAVADNVLSVVHATPGRAGNGYPLATTVIGAALSAATLEGGGTLAVAQAPLAALARFAGIYAYDLRFEMAPTYARLFGGALIITQGVTRT